jgi:hypothetical protein
LQAAFFVVYNIIYETPSERGEKGAMMPLIVLVGRSKSRTIILIEQLTPEFIRHGYRVATCYKLETK